MPRQRELKWAAVAASVGGPPIAPASSCPDTGQPMGTPTFRPIWVALRSTLYLLLTQVGGTTTSRHARVSAFLAGALLSGGLPRTSFDRGP